MCVYVPPIDNLSVAVCSFGDHAITNLDHYIRHESFNSRENFRLVILSNDKEQKIIDW